MDKFSVPFENTKLIGDVMMYGDEKPSVLVLHGAGNANRARWQLLREALLKEGIGSYAFDFVGHGETGGELTSSSLEHRANQVLHVVKALNIPMPLTIIQQAFQFHLHHRQDRRANQ
jgi:pimeloyl-ACP methyl ester carboxylesterase